MKFREFYELSAKVAEYEELLKEENQRRKAAMETYFQEVHGGHEVNVADLTTQGSPGCPMLVRKTPDL